MGGDKDNNARKGKSIAIEASKLRKLSMWSKVKLTVQLGAGMKSAEADVKKRTALQHAVKNGQMRIAELLLTSKADPDRVDSGADGGRSAMMLAVEREDMECPPAPASHRRRGRIEGGRKTCDVTVI